jgi:hypothetical protein
MRRCAAVSQGPGPKPAVGHPVAAAAGHPRLPQQRLSAQDRAGAGAAGAQLQRKARAGGAHVEPRGPPTGAVPELGRLRPIGQVGPPRPASPPPCPSGTPCTILPRARRTDHGSDEAGVLVETAPAGAGATRTSTTRSSGWVPISRRSCRRSRCPRRSGSSPGLARGACIFVRLGNLEMSMACGRSIAPAPLAQPTRPVRTPGARAGRARDGAVGPADGALRQRRRPASVAGGGPAPDARGLLSRGEAKLQRGVVQAGRCAQTAVTLPRVRRLQCQPELTGCVLLFTAARLGAQVHGGHRGVLLPPLEAAPTAHRLPTIRGVHAEGGEGAGARRGWAGSKPWRPGRPWVDTAWMMWPVWHAKTVAEGRTRGHSPSGPVAPPSANPVAM